ncbi:MAG: T9SS type A sorting domain-containing protein, partial [Paludibacter sp.]
NKNALVIAPFANAKPVSYTSVDAGRVWEVKPIYPGTGYYKAIADITGGAFGLRSGVHIAASSVLGGHIYTELPAEGIDISNLKYSYTIAWEKTKSSLIRFIARDVNGKWAMSTANISLGATAGTPATFTNNLTAVSWTNTDASFGLTTGGFDKTKVTAIGLCSKHTASWFIAYWLMKLTDFQLMDNNYVTKVSKIVENNPTLSLYPNPVIDQLNIRIDNEISQNIDIQITNLLGQVVENKHNFEMNNKSINCSVGHLEKGIYTISVWSNSKLIGVSKFVKANF